MLKVRAIRRSNDTRGSHDEASARIGQLDELRALAIAAVVLSHIAMAFGSRSRTAYWLNLPDLAVGVDLFFAISGFVIAVSLRQMVDAAEGDRVRAARAFYARRFFRIAVPAWATLVVIAIAASISGSLVTREDLVSAAGLMANVHWGLCPTARCGNPLQTSHFWSLAAEAQFYLLAPLLILVTGRKALAALVLTLAVLALVPRPHGSLMWALRPDALLLGMALAHAHGTKAPWTRAFPALSGGLAVFWLFIAAAAARAGVGPMSGIVWLGVAAISAGIVAGRLRGSPAIGRFGRAIRAIGRGSFSVYLVHLPIVAWAADFVAARAGIAFAVAIALGVTALASCALDLAVSQPAARLGRTISNNLLFGGRSGQAAGNRTEGPLKCPEPLSSLRLPG
jgi:peptidoglycan/LPS O-acetylase OafA/YrhL